MTVAKRRNGKKKLTKLSKTAKLLFDSKKLPRVLARLTGMFLGTDLPYCPGDTFVRFEQWDSFYSYSSKYSRRWVPLVRAGVRRCLGRAYRGRRFAVFEVLRVTPQTLTVRRIKTVDVYFKCWIMRHSSYEYPDRLEADTELAGVFSYERTCSHTSEPERVYIRRSDADALRQYNLLDTTQAQKLDYHNFKNHPRTSIWNPRGQFGVSKIMHDAESGKLVVKYFPDESIP
jgi:hypothetical protein